MALMAASGRRMPACCSNSATSPGGKWNCG
jgi:hypothetical protein